MLVKSNKSGAICTKCDSVITSGTLRFVDHSRHYCFICARETRINGALKVKKRNKKHNPVEAARKNNMRILKGFAVAFIANDSHPSDPIKLINLKGDEMPITKTMSDAITVFRYKWSVMLAVFCKEKNKNTCKLEIVEFKEPYLQSELVGYLNERHQLFIKNMKDKGVNIVGAGWLASPVGRDFTTEESGEIFKKLGAWG